MFGGLDTFRDTSGKIGRISEKRVALVAKALCAFQLTILWTLSSLNKKKSEAL